MIKKSWFQEVFGSPKDDFKEETQYEKTMRLHNLNEQQMRHIANNLEEKKVSQKPLVIEIYPTLANEFKKLNLFIHKIWNEEEQKNHYFIGYDDYLSYAKKIVEMFEAQVKQFSDIEMLQKDVEEKKKQLENLNVEHEQVISVLESKIADKLEIDETERQKLIKDFVEKQAQNIAEIVRSEIQKKNFFSEKEQQLVNTRYSEILRKMSEIEKLQNNLISKLAKIEEKRDKLDEYIEKRTEEEIEKEKKNSKKVMRSVKDKNDGKYDILD